MRDIIPLLHRSYNSPPTGQQQHQLVQPTALSDFFYSPATDSQLRLAERKQVNPDLPTYQVSTFNLSPTSQCLTNLYFQMLSSQPHPAVLRVRSRHSSTVARLRGNLQSLYTPPAPPPTVWSSKNPNIAWPTMMHERRMSESEWASSNFPHCPLPDRVVGQVNTQVWYARISDLLNEPKPNLGLINLMKDVSTQLKDGVDSHVSTPGTALTHCSNQLMDPDKVLPQVADALATFTARGHIAGPLFNIDHKQYEINPIMAIHKPGGHVRVVGNLSCPDTLSFNDGISEEWLED